MIPRDVSEVLLKVDYFAAPGALIGRAYSISSDLTYGLYSVLESRGTGFYSGVYWSLREDENTVFTIANVSDKETAARLELAHAGGKIELPPMKLLPNQTRTVNLRRDLRRLLREAGRELPEGALSGGYRLKGVDDPLRAELLVKEHVLNSTKKTAAPFYASCNYVTSVWLSAPTFPVQVALGGTTNVGPMCTWNVGGNEADYGASLQPDGGNEISISPQYGYTRTISGLNVGTRTMLLSSQVPRPPDPCHSQAVPASPQPQAQVSCPVPSGETTTAIGWDGSDPTIHHFQQRLQPTGTSFANRVVTESNAQAASDTCWFPGSLFAKTTGVTGGNWTVSSSNYWGPDAVGWQAQAVAYYQEERPNEDLGFPCQFTMYQRLTISCPGASSSVYRSQVILKGIINSSGGASERDGVKETY